MMGSNQQHATFAGEIINDVVFRNPFQIPAIGIHR